MGSGLKVTGFPNTPSVKRGVLASNGRSFLPFTLHAPCGVTLGRDKEFVCGVTTSQLLLSSIPSTPSPLE